MGRTNMPRQSLLLTASLLVFLFPPFSLLAAGPEADGIDGAVREALKAWRVPGAAVVIVRDDRVVYLAGQGLKEWGGKEPVTPDTLFPLGSCTKAFTTAAMALLVD